MIASQTYEKAMSYDAYRQLLGELLEQGKTTGNNQSAEYLDYAKINLQRMARLEKTTVLLPELIQKLKAVNVDLVWLVITEGWCGDASQNLPVIRAMASQNKNIDLKLVLRDENPELMDKYLTNGARSIPKLICLKKSDGVELFTWGPRPHVLQEVVLDLKTKGVTLEEKGVIVQKWYNEDKTRSIQSEFLELVTRFMIA